MRLDYEREFCPTCGQSMTYILPLDKGSVQMLLKIANFIRRKGINAVHPRKEMEGKFLSSNEVGNLSRPRFHGLIARHQVKGNYLLTKKGAAFLRGAAIPKFAIISKAEGRQIGYYEPEKYACRLADFGAMSDYWEGIDFQIEEGRVISNDLWMNEELKSKQQRREDDGIIM